MGRAGMTICLSGVKMVRRTHVLRLVYRCTKGGGDAPGRKARDALRREVDLASWQGEGSISERRRDLTWPTTHQRAAKSVTSEFCRNRLQLRSGDLPLDTEIASAA